MIQRAPQRKYDVHVVGAGPAGLGYALGALRSGKEVLISEAKQDPSQGVVCSGLVTTPGYTEMKTVFPGLDRCVLGRYRDIIIHLTEGLKEVSRPIEVRMKEPLVRLDRQALAGLMINNVKDRGGVVETGSFIGSVHDLRSKTIVGADGPNSTVSRLFSFPEVPRFVHAIQVEFIPNKPEEVEPIHVYFDDCLFPGFFGWVIPSCYRSDYDAPWLLGCGAYLGYNINSPFRQFLSMFNRKTAHKYTFLRKQSDIIPVSLRPVRYKNENGYNVLLVGDAAGHVKPFTGGGVYYGSMIGYYLGHGDMDMAFRMEQRLRTLNLFKRIEIGPSGLGILGLLRVVSVLGMEPLISSVNTDSLGDTLINIIRG